MNPPEPPKEIMGPPPPKAPPAQPQSSKPCGPPPQPQHQSSKPCGPPPQPQPQSSKPCGPPPQPQPKSSKPRGPPPQHQQQPQGAPPSPGVFRYPGPPPAPQQMYIFRNSHRPGIIRESSQRPILQMQSSRPLQYVLKYSNGTEHQVNLVRCAQPGGGQQMIVVGRGGGGHPPGIYRHPVSLQGIPVSRQVFAGSPIIRGQGTNPVFHYRGAVTSDQQQQQQFPGPHQIITSQANPNVMASSSTGENVKCHYSPLQPLPPHHGPMNSASQMVFFPGPPPILRNQAPMPVQMSQAPPILSMPLLTQAQQMPIPQSDIKPHVPTLTPATPTTTSQNQVDLITQPGSQDQAVAVVVAHNQVAVPVQETAQQPKNPVVKWIRMNPQIAKTCNHPPIARHGHKAVAYKNLMIVLSGGNEGMIDDLYVYNTINNEWSQPQCKGAKPDPRAAYGAVIDGHRVLLFGGMKENCVFTDELYELNVQRWEWTKLEPRPRTAEEKPCARIGHSFTLIRDKVYLFGGLSNLSKDSSEMNPQYLNELHVLMIRQNKQHGVWEMPVSYGVKPTPRESHSAVPYVSKDAKYNKIILYGGMFGNRLGDVFTLDVDTMMWSQIKFEPRGVYPLPRSLHSANVIGDKMFVFGGWVQLPPCKEESYKTNGHDLDRLDERWKVDDGLPCLNLKTMSWENVSFMENKEGEEALDCKPAARAGHCSVVINNKIYIWSGRDGMRKSGSGSREKQICHQDMWKLEVSKPASPGKVKLVKAAAESISVNWDHVPGADGYILQCMRFEMPPPSIMTFTSSSRLSA